MINAKKCSHLAYFLRMIFYLLYYILILLAEIFQLNQIRALFVFLSIYLFIGKLWLLKINIDCLSPFLCSLVHSVRLHQNIENTLHFKYLYATFHIKIGIAFLARFEHYIVAEIHFVLEKHYMCLWCIWRHLTNALTKETNCWIYVFILKSVFIYPKCNVR